MASSRVVTPEFRASYPNIFRPQPPRKAGQKETYNMACLFPADANLMPLKQIVAEVLTEKFGAKDNWPRTWRSPFRDQGEKESMGYEPGNVFISVKSTQKPGIVDRNGNPIIDESEVYAGCWCIAQVHAYWYDTEGNKGVAFGLDHVMKRRDDEPLDGRMKASEAFKEFVEGDEHDPFAGAEAAGDPLAGI